MVSASLCNPSYSEMIFFSFDLKYMFKSCLNIFCDLGGLKEKFQYFIYIEDEIIKSFSSVMNDIKCLYFKSNCAFILDFSVGLENFAVFMVFKHFS